NRHADRPSVHQRGAARFVEVVGEGPEALLRLAPAGVASPARSKDQQGNDRRSFREPERLGLGGRKERVGLCFLKGEAEPVHRQHDERENSSHPTVLAVVVHFPFVVITGGVCLSHTKRCRKSLLRLKMSIHRLWISDSWTSSGMTVSS